MSSPRAMLRSGHVILGLPMGLEMTCITRDRLGRARSRRHDATRGSRVDRQRQTSATTGISSTAPKARSGPCRAPELTVLLHTHLRQFRTDAQGRLFRGEHGGEVPSITYTRLLARAPPGRVHS